MTYEQEQYLYKLAKECVNGVDTAPMDTKEGWYLTQTVLMGKFLSETIDILGEYDDELAQTVANCWNSVAVRITDKATENFPESEVRVANTGTGNMDETREDIINSIN